MASGGCARPLSRARRVARRARGAPLRRRRGRRLRRSADAARPRDRVRAPLRRGPLVVLGAMSAAFARLHARLFPSAEGEGVVAAAPVVAMRELFARFWPLARPYRGWFAATLVLI